MLYAFYGLILPGENKQMATVKYFQARIRYSAGYHPGIDQRDNGVIRARHYQRFMGNPVQPECTRPASDRC